MDTELLGYVLNALDAEAKRQVEAYLESSPEARKKLAAIRRAVGPLQHDSDDGAPAGLAERTLRFVHGRVQPQERVSVPISGGRVLSRVPWRRADVVVAASIGLWFLVMIPPGLLYVKHQQGKVECADNLRRIHAKLASYAESHGGNYPSPEGQGKWAAAAGIYAPVLRQQGLWDDSMRINCPARGRGGSRPPSLEEVRTAPECDQPEMRKKMGGCYGYNLGYTDEANQYRGIHRSMGDSVPLMSDRPTRQEEDGSWRDKNSPNHQFRGQNVLHGGGNVQFIKGRYFGNDDIFLNQQGKLAPGRGSRDTVLAPSEATPFPDE